MSTNERLSNETMSHENQSTNIASSFLLSKVLKAKLKELSAAANPDGEKTVRWTDLLERGVSKLTPEDLVILHRGRTESMSRNIYRA